MMLAISFISGSSMPSVAGPGVPTRMPEGVDGGFGSNGMRVLVQRDADLIHDASRRPCRRCRAGGGRRGSGASRFPRRRSAALRRPGPARARARVRTTRCGVVPDPGVIASLSATAFAAMQCSSGPPCIIGNTALSIAFACSSLHRIMAPRGPRSALWVVNVTTSACGTGDGYAPPATSPMKWEASTQRSAPDLVGDLAERGEVDLARVRGVAGQDDLRLVLLRQVADLVHVELLGLAVHLVADEVEPHAATRSPASRA